MSKNFILMYINDFRYNLLFEKLPILEKLSKIRKDIKKLNYHY